MYRTCYYCLADLGTNDVLAAFPVGRALAFDSANGRLWVICHACERWNLSPFDERWEIIEQCEERFRDTAKRVQSDNIGLAVIPHRIDLVRVGATPFRELAAWRYGPEFLRRHLRSIAVNSALVLFRALHALGDNTLSVFDVNRGELWESADDTARRSVVSLPRGGYRSWQVFASDTWLLAESPAGLGLSVRHHFGRAELFGGEAERALAMLMPRVNRAGATQETIDAAAARIDREKPLRVLNSVVNVGLGTLPEETRLGVEMALHAETEQRVVDGELEPLKAAWREAAEIAGIADALLVPESVERELQRLKERARDAGRSDT